MKELVLGCGNYRKKRIWTDDNEEYETPVFLDIDPNTKPDILWDLNKMPLPFENDEFDEIHAYDVLEHIGTQGDIKRFFYEFSEYHRVLKDKGLFFITCPYYGDKWAWGDPGHTRILGAETFVYLSQEEYEKQVGVTQISDYRYLWKLDFKMTTCIPGKNSESVGYILECLK